MNKHRKVEIQPEKRTQEERKKHKNTFTTTKLADGARRHGRVTHAPGRGGPKDVEPKSIHIKLCKI
jgi:hypothetical protein